MKIVFFDSEGGCLGSLFHESIGKALVPAFKEKGPDVYMKYVFSSEPETLIWKVIGLEVQPKSELRIHLEAAETVLSVAEYAVRDSKKVESFLGEYQLVEVDFGFHSVLFAGNDSLDRNEFFNSALLPGEMHKRRPCIVLKAKKNTVRVIPLTSKEPANGDKSCIALSTESFKNLAPRYSQKTSYALLNMIQTVSAYRVHPPRNDSFKFEHKYRRYKLCVADKNAIKRALSGQFSPELLSEKDNLERKWNDLKKEKSKILDNHEAIKSELASLRGKEEFYRSCLLKVGSFLELDDGIDEITRYIEREL